MREFDAAERRARLSRRHRLAPGERAADVADAASAVVALHGTDPATVFLSAWARIDGLTAADVEKALYVDRTVVRHLAMRRTLWVIPPPLFGVVQGAASDRVAAQERPRLVKEVERAGLFPDGAAWLEAASAATLDALARLGEATSTELRDEVPLLEGSIVYAPDKSYGGKISVGPRVLTILSAAGLVVRASNRGRWYVARPAWTLTADWLGGPPPVVPAREAMAELVQRWLYAFGPATATDVKWWFGSTMGLVRTALADVGAVDVVLEDGGLGVALRDDLDPVAPVEPFAALLPSLDPTTMGWSGRDWYLGPHRAALFDTAGNAGPTIWWDGRIVGGWRQGESGDVELQLLEDVGADGVAAIEAEADRLTAWLDGVRVMPRFPSPLFRHAR